jgi:hypothetical protein
LFPVTGFDFSCIHIWVPSQSTLVVVFMFIMCQSPLLIIVFVCKAVLQKVEIGMHEVLT